MRIQCAEVAGRRLGYLAVRGLRMKLRQETGSEGVRERANEGSGRRARSLWERIR